MEVVVYVGLVPRPVGASSLSFVPFGFRDRVTFVIGSQLPREETRLPNQLGLCDIQLCCHARRHDGNEGSKKFVGSVGCNSGSGMEW